MDLKAIFFDLGDTLISSKIFKPNGELKAIEKAIELCRLKKDPSEYLPLVKKADSFLSSLIEKARCDKESLQDYGVRVIKDKYAKLIELMGGKPDKNNTDLVFKAHLEGIAAAGSLFPGVEETLGILKKRYKLGLLSNNISEYARGPIEHLHLERFFDSIVISGEENVRKPDPEIFHRALNRIGSDPSEAMMVGDSQIEDIYGAKSVGMTTVWVNGTDDKPLTTVKPDYTISEVRELLDIVYSEGK